MEISRCLRRAAGFLWAGLAALSGCSFLTSSEREYVSNTSLLELAARESRFVIDPSLFSLERLDIRDDTLTYQFRGVQHPGDHAWVVRFSEKSSEQDPVGLGDVYSLLPLIKEGRDGFEVLEEGERKAFGVSFKFVRYHFESPIRDGRGKPLPGFGVVVSLRVDASGSPIVYHLKLDNHGDRDDLSWQDLQPFLEATARS